MQAKLVKFRRLQSADGGDRIRYILLRRSLNQSSSEDVRQKAIELGLISDTDDL